MKAEIGTLWFPLLLPSIPGKGRTLKFQCCFFWLIVWFFFPFFLHLVCTELFVVLPLCSFICLQFCHFGFALSSWCVCGGWSGFWQMWTERGGSVGAQPSLPQSCLLQKVHLDAVCLCQVMWRGSTWEQEGAGLRVWVTRTCLGTIVIWEWC